MSSQKEALVRQQPGSLKRYLESQKGSLLEMAGSIMRVDRMLKVALVASSINPKLGQCTPVSILRSLMTAAELGLEAGSALGEAYLVPYWSKRANGYEAQLIPGYKGFLTLARRTGDIAAICAEVVYPGDLFEVALGVEQYIKHVPNYEDDRYGDPDHIKFAYAVAKFKTGGFQFRVVHRKEIESYRKRSQSADNGPWVTDYPAMAKKTAIRRLSSLLPMTVELAKAVAIADAEDSDQPDFSRIPLDSAIELVPEIPAELPKPKLAQIADRVKARKPELVDAPEPPEPPEMQDAPQDDDPNENLDEEIYRGELLGNIRKHLPKIGTEARQNAILGKLAGHVMTVDGLDRAETETLQKIADSIESQLPVGKVAI